MKYFYDFRRHFYSLLPTFANDMRYASSSSIREGNKLEEQLEREAGAAFLCRVQLESSRERQPRRECMSHHKTESHFAQNVSGPRDLAWT